MTGKKNAWEGIVLVPFIDQARLLAASNTVPDQALDQIEQDRNKRGVSHLMVYLRWWDYTQPSIFSQFWLFYAFSLTTRIYDGQSHGPWKSPAAYLSDIQDCHISCTTYELPPLSPDAHPFVLLPGTKTGLESPSGLPTLKTSQFAVTYVHAKVNVSDCFLTW